MIKFICGMIFGISVYLLLVIYKLKKQGLLTLSTVKK